MGAELGLGLIVAGGLTQAVGQYQQGRAQEANLKYNADVTRSQAEQERMEAVENTKRMRRNADEMLAKARVATAASGSVPTIGSPIAILGEIGKELELEVQDTFRQAMVRRNSLIAQASQFESQAKSAKQGARLMAAGTAVSTGAQYSMARATYGNSRLMTFNSSTPRTA